ncbi:unnamed protein product [Symbiodinium natans]|uniref:Uncharacterized protein n=1 Tax=Symbiodinium natans TaxID=878477 RepID=A0A812V6M8_9DINO|nr:unnamed protein product [Symbiodinium natans]
MQPRSLEFVVDCTARWNGLSSTERIDFLSCWLPRCGKTASDWNAYTEGEQMALIAEFFRAERQVSESQVTGANSSWWQALSTEQKLAHIGKAQISLSWWRSSRSSMIRRESCEFCKTLPLPTKWLV